MVEVIEKAGGAINMSGWYPIGNDIEKKINKYLKNL